MKITLRNALIAVALMAGIAPVAAQQFPVVPDRTVVGRIGGGSGSGPAQAIPFSTLQSYLGGAVFGPNPTVVGNIALWNNITGTLLKDAGGGITAFGLSFVAAANAAAAYGVLGVIPCAQTEAFTGDVAKSAGSCATAVSYTSPATGGVARTIRSKFAESISVTDFGAVCDGTTDDTTAIAAAFAAGASKKVTFPPGVVCKVKGSGSYVFTMTAPIIIDCQGAQILLDATTPNTRGLLLFAPPSAGDRLPSRRVTRCLLNMNGVGAATITIDTTATNTIEIGEFEIDHVRDTASGTTTGTNASIFVNNIGTNTNGGTFNVNFHDNVLSNGIYLNSVGDSIRIRDSILSGSKYGVYVNLISGAAGLIIEGNNVSAADPILVDAALGPVLVINNEFEQQITSTDPNGAVVNFRGGSSTLGLVMFMGNSINALVGTGSPNPLRIGAVSQAYVESNSFVSGVAGSACIVNATGAAATIIGASNAWSGCTTHVTATVAVKYIQVGASP